MRSCVWPGCDKVMPVDVGGCAFHMKQIPKPLRTRFYTASLPRNAATDLPKVERKVLEWIEQQSETRQR